MVLSIENLSIEFGHGRRLKRVVHDVTLGVGPGEIVALVGESGSGKTTIGRAAMGMIPAAEGTVVLCGTRVRPGSVRDRRALARDVQVISQDPYGTLNPAMPVGASIAEPLRAQGESRERIRDTTADLLSRVGLPRGSEQRFPAQFSGGERQRIAIARALSVAPRLVICDEPTSALDVSTQKRVLELLLDLRDEFGLSYLFISHDLAVVRNIADRVVVLSQGRIVEQGSAEEVCERPKEAYTRLLVDSVPVPDPVLQRARRAARSDAVRAGAGA